MAILFISLLAGEQVAAVSSHIKAMGILGLALSAQGARNEGSMVIEMESAGRNIMHHDHGRDVALHNATPPGPGVCPDDACGDACAEGDSTCSTFYCDGPCQQNMLKSFNIVEKWKPCHKVEGWIACPGEQVRQFGVSGTEFLQCGKNIPSTYGKRKYTLPMWEYRGNRAGCFMELTNWKPINNGGQCLPCKWGAQVMGAPTAAVLSWLPMHGGKNSAEYSVWGRQKANKVVDPAEGWRKWFGMAERAVTLTGRAVTYPVRRILCWMNNHPIATSLIKVGSIIAIGAVTGGAGAFVAAVVWASVAIAANSYQSAQVLSNLNPELEGWRKAACIANEGRKWLFAIALDVATCLIPVAAEAGTNIPWTEVHAVVKDWIQTDTNIAAAVLEGVNAGLADAEGLLESKIDAWLERKFAEKKGGWAKVSCTGVEQLPPSKWDPIGAESFQIDVSNPDKYAVSVRDRHGDPGGRPELQCGREPFPGQPLQSTCMNMRSLIVKEETDNMDLSGATADRLTPAPDGVVGWKSNGPKPWPYSAFPENDNYIGDRRMASDLEWEENQIWPERQRRLSLDAFHRMAEAYYYYVAESGR